MEILDKNVLYLITMDYDLNDIINLCTTSKTLNEKICMNDVFWYNKFKHDFPYLETTQSDAKRYYFELNKILKTHYNKHELLNYALSNKKPDLIKIALNRGADYAHVINFYLGPYTPNIEAFEYFIDIMGINNKEDGKYILKLILNNLPHLSRPNQCLVIRIMFSKIIPQLIKYLDMNNASNELFLDTTLVKFKEFTEVCDMKDFYDEWIGFYESFIK